MARPRKLLHGFGLNDADYVVRQHNSTTCPFYLTWANMIKRCYSESFKKTNPSYSQANVCEEWSRFSVFKKWMIEQDWVGKSLDKDLLSDSLIYSPETCIFVDPFINSFLTEKKRKQSKYPTGVLRVTNGKYRALIAERNNGNRWLGTYDTEYEASNAYRLAKSKQAIEIAKTISDQRIALALISRYVYTTS